ncbi:MAG: GNAT family N-acetyltransferase [Deltaproteobacteria bacterium]|nr:GNAT family N-acetyltransferase [Deltaproteobacteria bacterium]
MQKEAWPQTDEWLAGFLGCRVFRLNMGDSLVYDPAGVEKTRRMLTKGPCFAYAKAGTGEHEKLAILEGMGFRLIDTNITMEKKCSPQTGSGSAKDVRFAMPGDREAVRAIAKESFVFSRFHLDPMIDKETADCIKAGWVENYFYGKRGDSLVVGDLGSGLGGFLLLLHSATDLVIDLIAVAEGSRRKGLAGAMIAFAERQIPGFERILVGTQVANIPSIRLYEKLGFRFHAASYVFHFHHKG